jgi:hypothetical protein
MTRRDGGRKEGREGGREGGRAARTFEKSISTMPLKYVKRSSGATSLKKGGRGGRGK